MKKLYIFIIVLVLTSCSINDNRNNATSSRELLNNPSYVNNIISSNDQEEVSDSEDINSSDKVLSQSSEIGRLLTDDYELIQYKFCDMYRYLNPESINYSYVYFIYNEINEVFFEGNHYTGINYNYDEEYNIVDIGKTMGSGVYENQYFDIINSIISGKYYDVVLSEKKNVVYGDYQEDGKVYLIVHDIFDRKLNYNKIELEDYPRQINFAGAVESITITEKTIIFTYLSSKPGETIDDAVSKTVYLPIELK